MAGPDVSIARGILNDAPGLSAHPGLVTALVSGRASNFQVRAVGQFVDSLELTKQVELARSSGAHLPLSPASKAFLDSIGQPYDDVDAGRAVQHQPEALPAQPGFWHKVGSALLGPLHSVPGSGGVFGHQAVHGVLAGLDRASDVVTGGYRLTASGGALNAAGIDLGPLNHPLIPGVADAADRNAAENRTQMATRGYDSSNFFDVLAFYSHGEQVFSDLSPLRDQYGADQVDLASKFVQARNSGDAKWFAQLAAGKDPDTVAAIQQQLNDPHFQQVVAAVDSYHVSPGRDVARSLGLRPGMATIPLGGVASPGAKVDAFKLVSGTLDAAAAWYADPTLVAGKAYQSYKVAHLGLRSAMDSEGVRQILDPANGNVLARQVQRGFQALLDDSHVVATGAPEDAAAALARINGRTPELVPLVGDITGQTRVVRRSVDGGWVVQSGAPITTMDELTTHLVDTNALLRLSKGLAASETMLMPGAVSRFGYRAMKGAAAGKATERGLARKGWIDVRDDPARLLPTPGDAVDSTVPDDVAAHLGAAEARGTALLNERRYGRYVAPSSRAGRSLAFFSPGAIGSRLRYSGQRLTNLLPVGTRIDWADPGSVEQVRRFALTYMPKSEANLLTAAYAGADEAGRMAVVRGVLTQTAHAAGLPASVSGRQLMDRIVGDSTETYRAQQVYSPVAGADTYVNPATGEAAHAALWDGQLDTGIELPAFAAMQQHAAKASVWDWTMRSALSSGWADDVMGLLKPLWLLTGSNVARNVLEDWAGAGLRGQGGQLVRARSAIATRRILTGAFDNPVDARGAIGRAAGRVGDAVIVRHMRGLKASAHLAITDDDYLAALQDIGQPEVDAWLGRLAGDAHKAILSPGEADVVDDITRAGYQVKDLRVKLEPGGYDAVPADGGKGARAWSANLASRITGSGIGEHALRLTVERPATGLRLYRQDGAAAADLTNAARPQGVYFSEVRPGRTVKEAQDAAPTRNITRASHAEATVDDADILYPTIPDEAEETWGSFTAGTAALIDILGERAAGRVRRMTLGELRDHVGKVTGTDWRDLVSGRGGAIEHHELLEVLGAHYARKEGYKAVRLMHGADTAEFLALSDDAFRSVHEAAFMTREEKIARHAEFLGTDAAAEFRKRAQRAAHTKAGVPVTVGGTLDPQVQATALHDLASDQLDDLQSLLVGRDGNLIEPLAKYLTAYGRPPTAEWIAREIPDAQRPLHAIGKTWVAASGQSTADGVMSAIRSATRTGYQHLVEGPIEALSRQPIFLVNLVRAKRNLAGYADRLVEQGMTREAAEAVARHAAGEQAFHATVAQVDNPDLRTQMDVVGRNFFSFSRATQDFLRRWGRTFREDPTRLRRAQLAVEGGVHSGFVTKDDQGQPQFTYPGSGAAISALLHVGQALRIPGIVALPVQPNLSTKLIYLNAGLDNPIGFTVSPLVSTPVQVLGGLLPGHELGKADLDILMRGQLGAGRPVWEAFMPTVLRRFWAALDTNDRDSQAASAAKNAIVHLDAAGLTPPADATPGQRDQFLQRIRTGAHNQLFARAIFATFAPGAPSQPEQATSEDVADPFYRAQGIGNLQDEFRVMVNDYGYSKALAVWTKLHPDKLAFTISSTETAGKSQVVPATRGAEQWMQEHRDLLTRYRTVAGYFIPTDPGEFSQQAWQAQLESGLRTRKDLSQFYSDVRVRGAERQYYDALDARDAAVAQALGAGDDDQAAGIKEGFRLWSESFQAYNPLFAEKQASYQTRVVQAQQGLAELRAMLDDPKVPGIPDLPGVRAMVDAYAAHVQWGVGLRGQRSAEATAARAGEQSAFAQYMAGLVGQYPGIKDLYNGLFRPLDTDLDYLGGG